MAGPSDAHGGDQHSDDSSLSRSGRGETMSAVVYRSQVRIERVKGPVRRAYLPGESQPVVIGVHGAVAEHYKVALGAFEPRATVQLLPILFCRRRDVDDVPDAPLPRGVAEQHRQELPDVKTIG